MQKPQEIFIRLIDLKPQMKEVNLIFIVLEKEGVHTNSKGILLVFIIKFLNF
jgi:hypothetical protein